MNSGRKRGGKGSPANNHDLLKKPKLIIYFQKIKSFPKGKKYYKNMRLEKINMKGESKRISWGSF